MENNELDHLAANAGKLPGEPLSPKARAAAGPTDTFKLAKDIINLGESTILYWSIETAGENDVLTINQGIGVVTSGGRKTVAPSSNEEYILTVGDKEFRCSLQVIQPQSTTAAV